MAFSDLLNTTVAMIVTHTHNLEKLYSTRTLKIEICIYYNRTIFIFNGTHYELANIAQKVLKIFRHVNSFHITASVPYTLNYDYLKVVIMHMFIFKLEYVRSTITSIVDPLRFYWPQYVHHWPVFALKKKIRKRVFNILPT